MGVDVGTKAEIYRLFGALLRQGAGIMLISSYLPEVYELADRCTCSARAGRSPAIGYQGRGHETDPDGSHRRLMPTSVNRDANARGHRHDGETVAEAAQARSKFEFSRLLGLTLVGVLAADVAFLSWQTDRFATPGNISNLLRQGAIFAILAMGQTFVIITGGIDLSVGAVVGFIRSSSSAGC